MPTRKLVIIGSINADHILNVEHFPRPGETIKGNHYHIAYGGKGANQAVAAGRGGANVQFIAAVGDDDIGQAICQQLKKDHIDTGGIEAIAQHTTGVALIFVNSEGENQIGINAGANAAVTPTYLAKHQQKIIDADAILMQLETPLETIIHAAELAQKHKTQVIINPAPAQSLPDNLLALIDIITPNETEAERLTGISVSNEENADKASQILHDKGIKIVIITLGSKGAWVSVNRSGQLIAGFNVKAIDTIAAGDTFNGMLITALLEGNDLFSAVKLAHAAAAIAVTRPGAQPSIPWRNEVDEFLLQQR